MTYLFYNLKNRKCASIFLILGIFIGISMLSFNISYTEALKNKNSLLSLKDSEYSLFAIGSTKKLSSIEKYILDLSNNSYVNLSVPFFDNENKKYTLVGVRFNNLKNYMPNIIEGSFFSINQGNSSEKIAIVGAALKNKIYEKNKNHYIKVKNQEFRVIGINKTINDVNSIFIPMTTFFDMNKNEEILNIKILTVDKLIKQNSYYKNMIQSLSKDSVFIDLKSNSYSASNYILTFISFLIFIIAIVNIANFTIFWVDDRKKEIAIRKAVGATNKDIRKLLFSEMFLLSFIALILSMLGQAVIYFIINSLLILDFYLTISLKNLIFSSLISIGISFISSIPAYRKSTQIQPAMILKEE